MGDFVLTRCGAPGLVADPDSNLLRGWVFRQGAYEGSDFTQETVKTILDDPLDLKLRTDANRVFAIGKGIDPPATSPILKWLHAKASAEWS